MKKRKIIVLLTTTLISACLLFLLNIKQQSNNESSKAIDDNYSLTINKGISFIDSYGTIKNTRGTYFSFQESGYTYSDNSFGIITNGYVLNTTAINGIKSINVSLSSGSFDLYNGWKDGDDIYYASSPFQTISGNKNVEIDLSSISPSYFKIVSESNANISSLIINYSCSEISKNNLRFTVNKPLVGTNEEISNDNYLFLVTNIEDISSSSWPSYLMNRNSDGTWYYDFNNIATKDGYAFSLFLSNNNTSPDWSYGSTANGITFNIKAGQTEFYDGMVYQFASQPKEIITSYNLNLTINISGINSTNFGNIQFIYNDSDSLTDYNWNNTISSSAASQYQYAMNGLDSSSTLYFKIYIWDKSLGNIRIGDIDNANFVLEPKLNEENLTISFTYPTTASILSGTNYTPIVGEIEIEGREEANPSTSMYFANQVTNVYGAEITINPTFDNDAESFTCSYEDNNIRIDNHKTIVGLKAGTTTKVTLTSQSGLTCDFNVTVSSSTYSATSTRDAKFASSEGWFKSTTVSEITNMGSNFINGIDVSSAKALYDNGSKFYNANGVEQSLFYILKENGVNWIRLKLWNDPQTSSGVSYGGGESNLENTLWMAHEAKAAGLKLLLDFHYSDFWVHPAQQVLPKAWKDVTSSDELATLIRTYTKDTLNSFKNNDCLPDMVQLGNEISSGSFLQKPGSGESFNAYGEPGYLTGATSLSDSIKATAGSNNMKKYLNAAANGVNDVDSSIKKVIHWAKGSSISGKVISNFFNSLSTVDYDYAGISFYPYYCFDSISDATSILSNINISKPWFIAETSYPFSGSSYVYENNKDVTKHSVSDWTSATDITTIKNTYSFTPSGQANLIHDLTEAVVNQGGLGLFYWEGAWVPNKNVGWAGSGSACTWSNQGFFSYNGKVIANINLFAQMSPYIV